MPSLSQLYRPRTFADVTGQTPITETLRKEVETQRLAHAFLFCGPRGVGKTTCARILAQAIQCAAPVAGEPCHACDTCQAFDAGKLLDVIELDAATHTGIDTVRESIIEHMRFAPTHGKAKVYILDEAHKLSDSAWNALLKTLEEPPAYVFFIFATTEWHKIPATIVSRCQRFEFRRIADDALLARLQEIAAKQQWTLHDEAARLIVSRSEGCVRDAETLLAQVAALSGEEITLDRAYLVIPRSRLPLLAKLLQAWAQRAHAQALQEAKTLFDEGVLDEQVFDDLIAAIRRLLLAHEIPNAAQVWARGTEEEKALTSCVGAFTPGELHDMALMLMERRRDAVMGMDPLFLLQLASTAVCASLLRHSHATYVATPAATAPVREVPVAPPSAPPITPSVPAPVQAPVAQEVAPLVEPRAVESTMPVVEESIAAAPAPQESSRATPGDTDMMVLTARSKWNAIIQAVDEKNHSLPFILKISQPYAYDGSTLTIRFQYPFHRDKVITDLKNRNIVQEAVSRVLGVAGIAVEGMVQEDVANGEQRQGDMAGAILKTFGGQVVE